MSKSLKTAYICQPCFKRLFSTTPRILDAAATLLPPTPPPSGRAKLTSSRRLILLDGVDAPKYLGGAITARIPEPSHKEGFYSAFLNARGRVLADVFVYPTSHSAAFCKSNSNNSPSYMIECDATFAKDLLSHIKKYKLRSKFTYRLVDEGEWDVWSVWGHAIPQVEIGCTDSRAPEMGTRIILPNGAIPEIEDSGDLEERHKQYTIRRYLMGVPEGQIEMSAGASLPQESNIDYMGGIDYRKGCYVGQELTIRTHHTGVVRKRMLPIQLYTHDPPTTLEYSPAIEVDKLPPDKDIELLGSEVTGKARPTGKFVASMGNVGLALCKLEVMTDIILTDGGKRKLKDDEFGVKTEEGMIVKVMPFIPAWHRGGDISNRAL